MSMRKGMTVLVAEADTGVATLIHSNLVSAGFDVIHAETTDEALKKTRDLAPALVILDMLIPGMPGKEALRALKSAPATCDIPIVAVSNHGEEIDRIIALELGADDYVAKPFSPRELALRVRAILSRRGSYQPGSPRLSFGRLALDTESRTVLIDGKPVDLSMRDFRLLAALMDAGGRVVSRERLIESAWGQDSGISPRTVDTQLRRLREKIRAVADQIHTVRGFGYRMGE